MVVWSPLLLPNQRPRPFRPWSMAVVAPHVCTIPDQRLCIVRPAPVHAPAPSCGSMVHCHIGVGAVHIFLTGSAAPSVPSIYLNPAWRAGSSIDMVVRSSASINNRTANCTVQPSGFHFVEMKSCTLGEPVFVSYERPARVCANVRGGQPTE